jgi:methylenetetrahydrofolate reductase (NADPH)
MCLNAYSGFVKMAAFCKARVPEELKQRMEAIRDDVDAVKKFGVEFGAKMCRELLSLGAPGLHFYTLNLELVTLGILEALGMRHIPDSAATAKVEVA